LLRTPPLLLSRSSQSPGGTPAIRLETLLLSNEQNRNSYEGK
jgi:hypothetical protein